jgi:translation elongation factor EF-G
MPLNRGRAADGDHRRLTPVDASDDYFIDFDFEEVGDDLCTVSRSEHGEGKLIQNLHGVGKYAHVRVVVGPHPGIRCYRFTWRPLQASLPLPFMRAACLSGVRDALLEPVGAGQRIAFVEVSIVDGSYHDRETDEQSVRTAAYLAVKDALTRCRLISV